MSIGRGTGHSYSIYDLGSVPVYPMLLIRLQKPGRLRKSWGILPWQGIGPMDHMDCVVLKRPLSRSRLPTQPAEVLVSLLSPIGKCKAPLKCLFCCTVGPSHHAPASHVRSLGSFGYTQWLQVL